ncbi:hypothetical protein J2Z31_000066 [Sinorhizobium kostiense]|uniref:Uncharacterized protein n=1 Tax=Sinorhizobium kostiense TaxID=76747 RepID=A0ABS4QTW0_9HYPH|nr:hypothetical protein [Sinorhizobium kostiense]
MKGALNPQGQLGSTETINAEITLDPAQWSNVDRMGLLRVQLAQESRYDRKQVASARILPVNCGR